MRFITTGQPSLSIRIMLKLIISQLGSFYMQRSLWSSILIQQFRQHMSAIQSQKENPMLFSFCGQTRQVQTKVSQKHSKKSEILQQIQIQTRHNPSNSNKNSKNSISTLCESSGPREEQFGNKNTKTQDTPYPQHQPPSTQEQVYTNIISKDLQVAMLYACLTIYLQIQNNKTVSQQSKEKIGNFISSFKTALIELKTQSQEVLEIIKCFELFDYPQKDKQNKENISNKIFNLFKKLGSKTIKQLIAKAIDINKSSLSNPENNSSELKKDKIEAFIKATGINLDVQTEDIEKRKYLVYRDNLYQLKLKYNKKVDKYCLSQLKYCSPRRV